MDPALYEYEHENKRMSSVDGTGAVRPIVHSYGLYKA